MYELISMIRNNPHNSVENWKEFSRDLSGIKAVTWLLYALLLQIIHALDEECLFKIVNRGTLIQKMEKILIKTGLY